MKRIIVFCLVFITIFSACKKENSPTLPGKWTIENTVVREYVNNMLDDTYTEQGDGTKIDFQNNGHEVITYPDNSVESFPYTHLTCAHRRERSLRLTLRRVSAATRL
jgi:hypothetical protein